MSIPPSSPRLPSPPPPAEIQIGPKSPLVGPNATRQAQQIEQPVIDANAKRRIHPGTRSDDMAAGPPLVPLHELDSAFQLQEHLAALHYHHTAGNTCAITRETAKTLATPPPGIDKTLWLYELCRFLIAQCNSLIVGFLFDTPPCSAATCPEMRASEWQFLCAVHDTPKSCCAIDYCCHTLDWAANVVTNPKIFPSRFVVDAHDKNTALKNLVNVFRRLHRIFAHAWFQHRGVFWSVEGQTGLYVLFKTVCDIYDLLPAENYKLPPEAEGLESVPSGNALADGGTDRKQQHPPQIVPTSIAKPPAQRGEAEDENFNLIGRTNTRRHIKSSPSVGSAVTTVLEADEDDTADVTSKLRGMRISANQAAAAAAAAAASDDDEVELASIPVIVEHGLPQQPPLRPSSVIPPSNMYSPSNVFPPSSISLPTNTPSTVQEEMSLEPELPEPEDTPAPFSKEEQPRPVDSALEPAPQPAANEQHQDAKPDQTQGGEKVGDKQPVLEAAGEESPAVPASHADGDVHASEYETKEGEKEDEAAPVLPSGSPSSLETGSAGNLNSLEAGAESESTTATTTATATATATATSPDHPSLEPEAVEAKPDEDKSGEPKETDDSKDTAETDETKEITETKEIKEDAKADDAASLPEKTAEE